MDYKKAVFSTLNYIILLVLTALLLLVFIWPEYLPYIHMDAVQVKLLIVLLVSLDLLVNAFSFNLSLFWKTMCAFLSIIVMVEFVMMNEWWRVFVR